MERVMGIEPTYSAWKAGVLPLNYTRKIDGASGRSRTGTEFEVRRILSPVRLPISPPRHYCIRWWGGTDSNHRTKRN